MLLNAYKLFRNCCKHIKFKHIQFNNVFLPFSQVSVRLGVVTILPSNPYKTILGISILSWLGFVDDDEKTESELILTLKRGVLAYKREEYNKAEQLLHVALRLAQQQRSEQGITYCYDLMANVAFDNYQLDKAQKLFVQVLQRLLRNGLSQDDLKVIHISLKIARINHLKGDNETAYVGYNWCLDQIAKKKDTGYDAKMLYGVIQDWYAQFLLDLGEVTKSLKHLKEAYSTCLETTGENSQQSMLLLNDLGTTSWRAGDTASAENLFNAAIKIGNNLEDKSLLGVIHANLGLIFLEKGVIDMAKKYCKEALSLGNLHKSTDSVEQANYCFDQIQQSLSK